MKADISKTITKIDQMIGREMVKRKKEGLPHIDQSYFYRESLILTLLKLGQ